MSALVGVSGSRRALVTGSSDGIGAAVADALAAAGYEVVRHARSRRRADACIDAAPAGTRFVVGDLASLAATRALASEADEMGPYDVVIHNAGTAASPTREVTVDGIERTLQVNALAPYVLTALLAVSPRLVYVSSDSIRSAHLDLDDLQSRASWEPGAAYARSKIALTALAMYVARHRPTATVNAVHPGWVRSNMSGDEAPLSAQEGADTIVWLALARDPAARVTGNLFFERRAVRYNDQPHDIGVQARVVDAFEHLSGVTLP